MVSHLALYVDPSVLLRRAAATDTVTITYRAPLLASPLAHRSRLWLCLLDGVFAP